MAEPIRDANGPRTLGDAARASIVWGGGSTIARDIVQFATMLLMVRLLSPSDYGSAALAQSIIGLVSVFSFGMFVLHALQLRDPSAVDWQAHFTWAAVVNSTLFCLSLMIASGLWASERYREAALPLAGLATGFLVEIAATLRHRMLETQHAWRRFRTLLMMGTLLGSAVGLSLALMGGGVWALVVQAPLFGLPAAIDLFWGGKWRPDWSWSFSRYRESVRFGINRIGAAAVLRGRQTVEHTSLVNAYDFAVLGVFSRTIGLATLIAGRIGTVAMASLYPVVTRAEQRSIRFQRIAGLVLRSVWWATAPAATFLAVCAADVVALLYGSRWLAVVPLLPLAVIGLALSGTASAMTSLLLANNEGKVALAIDLASAVLGVGLALWLIPLGIELYLAALVGHGFVLMLLTTKILVAKNGIGRTELLPAFVPAVIASAGGALAIAGLRQLQGGGDIVALRLLLEGLVFGGTYLALLRVGFPGPTRQLLEVAPGGSRIARIIFSGEAGPPRP